MDIRASEPQPRNPARPKVVMRPCDCGLWYVISCECAPAKPKRRLPGYLYIPIAVFVVCVLIVGARLLFGG